jgi:hypothetical protein
MLIFGISASLRHFRDSLIEITGEKNISYAGSSGKKYNAFECCIKSMMKCWTSCKWRVIFVCALTIHNDHRIDASRNPGCNDINTRALASRTFGLKQSFVTLGQRISIAFRLRHQHFGMDWPRSHALIIKLTSGTMLDVFSILTSSNSKWVQLLSHLGSCWHGICSGSVPPPLLL